ncbi:MAG: hypothetical protein KGK01_01250 [Bradyrhizobium sp.]|uniref:hypothetical protein n=1 Tax=Bradyrhizobium sp. TaxID=376 RepID=UPI0023A6C80A|nr:hypothetical protein [Bradyrhizobium sp.]MDE2067510.1 hypothetical protein [Bradyrhizobium sp.]MDE2241092.1 hypothetical protein [Bradyrhizobium sp.]
MLWGTALRIAKLPEAEHQFLLRFSPHDSCRRDDFQHLFCRDQGIFLLLKSERGDSFTVVVMQDKNGAGEVASARLNFLNRANSRCHIFLPFTRTGPPAAGVNFT